MAWFCNIWLPLAIFLYTTGTATFVISLYFVIIFAQTNISIYAYMLIGLISLAIAFLFLQINQYFLNRHYQLISSNPAPTATRIINIL
jgi:uncharacterized membrane protein